MRLASRLLQKGLPLPVLFIVSLAALGTRILLLGVLRSMTGVMVTQILMSIGFAGFLRFNIDYVASLFPRQYAGRAILISVAVTQGIGWRWSFSLWVNPLRRISEFETFSIRIRRKIYITFLSNSTCFTPLFGKI